MTAAEGDPAPRIGDSERDLAVEYLQQHTSAGRLSPAEFEERMSQALGARTAGELTPLFRDLPEPRPVVGPGGSLIPSTPGEVAHPGPGRRTVIAGRALAGLSWPAAIVAASILGWGSFWWFIFFPIFVTPWLLGLFGLGEDGQPDDEDDDDGDEDEEDGDQRRR